MFILTNLPEQSIISTSLKTRSSGQYYEVKITLFAISDFGVHSISAYPCIGLGELVNRESGNSTANLAIMYTKHSANAYIHGPGRKF